MPLNTPGFDFASRDYENIRRDLLSRASQVTPEWVDRDASDFGMLFVDLWSYMGDIIHYYIDRAAGESFITTATQRESVLALSNLFDYTPFTRTPAQAIVYVSNTSSASVTIPDNTVFVGSSENGTLDYFTTSSVSLNAGQTSVAITVTEGKRIFEEVVTNSSSGQINQRYALSKVDVVPTSVQVYVYEDGLTPVAWNRVNDVALSATGSSVYSVNVNADNETEIVFGNRITGRVPPTNSKITVSYNTTSGAAGNIAQNKILTFKSSQPSGVAVVSSSAATGGSSGETIDSIKTALRAKIRSQNRAVTLQDFVDLTTQVSGVYKAVAKYEANSDPTSGGSVTVYGLPYVSDYTNYGSASVGVSASVRNEITALIQPKAMLGVTVVAGSAITLRPKSITATVYVDDTYVANSVKIAVENALNNLFEIAIVDFGSSLKLGDVYRTIHAVEGVLYADGVSLSGTDPSNVELLRKGTITITTSGGITTTV